MRLAKVLVVAGIGPFGIGLMAAPAIGAPALSGSVAVVTDYRFRGVSLSNRGPALQGGLDLAFDGGWFGSLWASTNQSARGTGSELDLAAGKSGRLGPLDYQVQVYAYLDTDRGVMSYMEAQGSLAWQVAGTELQLDVAAAPEQATTDTDNIYVSLAARRAFGESGWSLGVRAGYESGFYRSKIDWELSTSFTRGPITVTGRLVGTRGGGSSLKDANPAVVASLLASF